MNIILVSSLLGLAAFILHIAANKALPQTVVSVWPPGPNFYLGEYVVLHCRVESNSTFAWTYHWYKAHPLTKEDPRHLVSGENYSITGLRREDVDYYWCKAEEKESNTTATEASVMLNVSVPSSHMLTLTPNSRQIFTGERFTVQCPASQSLKHFSDNLTEMCSSTWGAVCENKCERCVFTATSENGGFYWCQSAEGRSRAVNITVSHDIILKAPALPVNKGKTVNLSCQYRTEKHHEAIFLKNKAKLTIFNSSMPDKVINLTIDNVTQEDEGFYMCTSLDGTMQSPESWLSVIDDQAISPSMITPTTSTNENWKWIVVSSSIVLLFLIPLTVWLVWHIRHHTFSTRSCWPPSKEDVPAVQLPKTKQDATEVQWDLSWMEMSNLLDKQLYPNT